MHRYVYRLNSILMEIFERHCNVSYSAVDQRHLISSSIAYLSQCVRRGNDPHILIGSESRDRPLTSLEPMNIKGVPLVSS